MVDILEKYLNKRLALVNDSIDNNVKTLYTVAILLNANITERNNIYNEKKLKPIDDPLVKLIDAVCNYYIDKNDTVKPSNSNIDNESIDIDLDTATIESDENLDSMTDHFMQQQIELDDLIAEKRKLANEMTYIPKRDIKFYLDTKPEPPNTPMLAPNPPNTPMLAPEQTTRDDNVNTDAFANAKNPNNKPLAPMNALTRIPPNERDELLYNMFLKAKNNITKKEHSDENVDQLIRDEADRLLKLYLETH